MGDSISSAHDDYKEYEYLALFYKEVPIGFYDFDGWFKHRDELLIKDYPKSREQHNLGYN